MNFLILLLLAAVELKGVKVEENPLRVLLLTSKRPSKIVHFTLNNPPRIVLDLKNTKLKTRSPIEVNWNELVRIRMAGRNGGKDTRVVLDLKKTVPYKLTQSDSTVTVILNPGKVYVPPPHGQESVKFYRSRGKRDPFIPLLGGEEESEDTLLNVGNAKLVGIIEENGEKIALVKDAKMKGFILRTGDRVEGGVVERIGDDFITFKLTDYGIVRRITIKMEKDSRRAK